MAGDDEMAEQQAHPQLITLSNEQLQGMIDQAARQAVAMYDTTLDKRLDTKLDEKLKPITQQLQGFNDLKAKQQRMDDIQQAVVGKLNEFSNYAHKSAETSRMLWHKPLREQSFNLQNGIIIKAPLKKTDGQEDLDRAGVERTVRATLGDDDFEDCVFTSITRSIFKVTVLKKDPIHARKLAATLIKSKAFNVFGATTKYDSPKDLRDYQSKVLTMLWKAKSRAGKDQTKCFFYGGMARVGDIPLFPEYLCPKTAQGLVEMGEVVFKFLDSHPNIDSTMYSKNQTDQGVLHNDALRLCAKEQGVPELMRVNFGLQSGGYSSLQGSHFFSRPSSSGKN